MNAIKAPSMSRKGLLGVAASFGVLAAIGNGTASATSRDGVVGAWSLVSFDIDEGKGSSKPRFGRDPVGYLLIPPMDAWLQCSPVRIVPR